MSITFKIWDSNSNFVSFEPKWGADESASKTLNSYRVQQGKLYRYTYGHWNELSYDIELVPNSVAIFINSLWLDHQGCVFEVDLNGNSEIYSMSIVNNELPFSEFANPECTRMNGKLSLVEY